jgi:[ribosomal protein S18]-alanine N-acetyltransferase
MMMELKIQDMTESFVKEILLWKYEHPYNFYNNETTEETIREFMNGDYFAVVDGMNSLIGFFCLGSSSQVPTGRNLNAYDENMIDIGLGLKPELTGNGLGKIFITFILRHIENNNKLSKPLRLTVATFNKRAIRLYENVGFAKKIIFNSNNIEFQTMIKY